MLNPDGESVKAFESPNMLLLSVVVGLFCVLSATVWLYFNRLGKRAQAHAAD
jgi:hypothetical protein